METFKSYYLTELFDSKVPIKVTVDNDVIFSSFFDVPAEKPNIDWTEFKFHFAATKVGDHPWDIVFVRSNAKEGQSSIDAFNDLTPKETLMVFSGVKASLMKWFKSRKPQRFTFTAKSSETSRVKLYKKFAKLIARKLDLEMISGTVKGTEKFVFSRKGLIPGFNEKAKSKVTSYTWEKINMALLKAGVGPKIIMQLMLALNVARGLGLTESLKPGNLYRHHDGSLDKIEKLKDGKIYLKGGETLPKSGLVWTGKKDQGQAIWVHKKTADPKGLGKVGKRMPG